MIRAWAADVAMTWVDAQNKMMQQRMDELEAMVGSGSRMLLTWDKIKHDSAILRCTLDYDAIGLTSVSINDVHF